MVSIICHCAVSVSWRLCSMSACSVATVPSGFAAGFGFRRSVATVPSGFAAGHLLQHHPVPGIPGKAQPLRAFRPPSISHCAQRFFRWVWLCSLSAQHAVSLVHGLHVCALLRLLHNLW